MDAVVKVGGSLAESPRHLEALCAKLSDLAKAYQFVVVPGGGSFADKVRQLDARFHLPAAVSHRMAILAMDQYGLLLAHLTPESATCDSFEAAAEVSTGGRVAILLPSKMLFDSDPFVPSWDVTSDSIAAYIAWQLNARRTVFVTDVDGIFTEEPKWNAGANLLPEVSVEELARFSERTSVDKFLPQFLASHPLDCFVVNGKHPERLAAVLAGQNTVATRILSAAKP